MGTIDNLAAQMKSDAALRESERDLRHLTDNLPVLISCVGADRRYRFVNGTYEAWFGHKRAEIEGGTCAMCWEREPMPCSSRP
jgi:PAS domain S-box-containing protein